MSDQPHVREEWEVTGEPGEPFPPYRFVFGDPNESNKDGSPEQRARDFVEIVRKGGGWYDTIRLRSRVITESPWREEDL